MDQEPILPPIDRSGNIEEAHIHFCRWTPLIKDDPSIALCGRNYRTLRIRHDDRRPFCPECNAIMAKLYLTYGDGT